MKKLNKKSLKQQGGQSVNPQEQQMMQQQQQQQQQQGQQQQQDPTAELAASFSEMVESGYDPKQAVMEFIKAEVPEELIYQTLLKVGYSENDVQALFTQVSEEVQQASNEQKSMMQPQQQPQQQMQQAQKGLENQYNIKQDEGIISNRGARFNNWMSQIDPSAGYNRGDVLSKGLKLAETLGDTFKPKYSFSQGMNPFNKKDKNGDGFADGWFMDSKKKNLLKKNLRHRDKNIRKLQGRSIKIHENDPNDYRFNSMGDFMTTQQYDDDVKKYSTAQFVSPTNSYKGYAYDSNPTPYMTPQQKNEYLQHKQEFGTVGDFWKDPITGKSKKPKKQQKSKGGLMDFMKGYKYGGDLDKYQFQGEALPPSPLEPITFKDWYKKDLYRNSGIPPSELNALYEKETGNKAGSPAVDVDGTKPWTSPEFMPPTITDPNKSKRTWNQIGNVAGKVGEIAYQGADFFNEAAKAWQDLAKPTYTADNLYDFTQNPAGGQGYYDVNSGSLDQPNKGLEGYGWAQRGGSNSLYKAQTGVPNQKTMDYLGSKYNQTATDGIYRDFDNIEKPDIKEIFRRYNANAVSKRGVPFTTRLTSQQAMNQGKMKQWMEQNPTTPVQYVNSKDFPKKYYDNIKTIPFMEGMGYGSSGMGNPRTGGNEGSQNALNMWGEKPSQEFIDALSRPYGSRQRGGGDKYRTRNIPPISLIYEDMYKNDPKPSSNWLQHIKDSYPKGGYRGSQDFPPYLTEFYADAEAFKPKRGGFVDEWGEPLPDNWERRWPGRRREHAFWNVHSKNNSMGDASFDPLKPRKGQEDKWEQLKEKVRVNHENDESWMDYSDPRITRPKGYKKGGNIDYGNYMPVDMYGHQNAFSTFGRPVYQYGGQPTNIVEVDDRMIQKLIAAGADIEYL